MIQRITPREPGQSRALPLIDDITSDPGRNGPIEGFDFVRLPSFGPIAHNGNEPVPSPASPSRIPTNRLGIFSRVLFGRRAGVACKLPAVYPVSHTGTFRMAEPPVTRVTLLTRIRDGRDADAWRFVQLYGPVVYRFAHRGLKMRTRPT